MSDQYNGQGRTDQRNRTFNPNEHVMQLKSKDGLKDYLPVQWRLVWFRSLCPGGTVETEMIHFDPDRETEEEVEVWNEEKQVNEKVVKRANGFAVFRAIVKDGKGGVGTGTKSEKAASFLDYVEKAETGAIGRALASLGYGTQFAGDEFSEAHRIVDSPIQRVSPVGGNGQRPVAAVRPNTQNIAGGVASNRTNGNNLHQSSPQAPIDPKMPITDQQLSSIRKLSQHLSKAEPEQVESMSYGSAKEVIAVLSQEYRQSRSKAS